MPETILQMLTSGTSVGIQKRKIRRPDPLKIRLGRLSLNEDVIDTFSHRRYSFRKR
jgi:hypothetical protein